MNIFAGIVLFVLGGIGGFIIGYKTLGYQIVKYINSDEFYEEMTKDLFKTDKES